MSKRRPTHTASAFRRSPRRAAWFLLAASLALTNGCRVAPGDAPCAPEPRIAAPSAPSADDAAPDAPPVASVEPSQIGPEPPGARATPPGAASDGEVRGTVADLASSPQMSPAADRGVIRLVPGVRVDRERRRVELDAEVCLDAGWLEQVACSPGTREHEALVTIAARPRDIHAALLLLGLEAGSPGAWSLDGDALVEIPPRGPALRVLLRVEDTVSGLREIAAAEWIRDVRTGAPPPLERWLFTGSTLITRGDGSVRYEADASGSIIGLVTFGDEVIGLPIVRPDAESVAPPEWEAFTERLPPIGTPVVVVLDAIPPHPTSHD